MGKNNQPMPTLSNTAIILLAYADYEALEISLANYGKHFKNGVKLFILWNGRNTFDTEYVYKVAKRYQNLYPNNIVVVDNIAPQKPYFAIRELINSDRLKGFDYICKVDDDVFPINDDWLEKLCAEYNNQYKKYGDKLAYISGLVNNNPFGFKQIIDRSEDLASEYYGKIARDHIAGNHEKNDYYPGLHNVKASEIDDDVCGTIWQLPYIVKWLHRKTTMMPQEYSKMTANWPAVEVGDKRYSINVMLFKKEYWDDIYNEDVKPSNDDELLSEQYCKKNHKKVVVDLSNPFVHLAFFSQKDEMRSMMPEIRVVYEDYLQHSYSIAIQPDKLTIMEDRMRYIDNNEKHKMLAIERLLAAVENDNGKNAEKLDNIKGELDDLFKWSYNHTLRGRIKNMLK